MDPEDLRKLSTTLSALATEKQKAAKVRDQSFVWNINICYLVVSHRLLPKQRVKRVRALQLARVPEGWTWINTMIT